MNRFLAALLLRLFPCLDPLPSSKCARSRWGGVAFVALLALLCAGPAQARKILDVSPGTLNATYTSPSIWITDIHTPIVVVLGYTSVNLGTITVSIEASIDNGVTWAVPGLVASTPTSTLTETLTGNGNYILFPIVVNADQGGSTATEVVSNIGSLMRVKVVNNHATDITNLGIEVLCE